MASVETARALALDLRRGGFEAYLAGGCVRDLLLGRPPADYDIATSATPEQIRRLFPATVPVGAAFGVVRVAAADGEYEVATFRAEGPYLDGRHPSSVRYATVKEDVLRRDFTINGLLYDPQTAEILDWVGGRADLDARVIRTIGDPSARFAEDHLRMLRAVRQAAELGFTIAPETAAAIRRHGPDLARVSAERIRDELVRLVTGPNPSRGLVLLRESDLLGIVLPEVAGEIGIAQPDRFHPEGDVFEHTRRVLGALRTPSVSLAMAALLHDAGKPETFVRAADRIRFDRHDEIGAAIARRVMERLRFSRRETDRVAALVERHMVFKDVLQMREARRRRLFADETFPELLELHRADCLASHGDLSTYEWITRRLAELAQEPQAQPRLITGEDVLALGVPPGPRVGAILHAVEDARLEAQVRTREEALALARRLASEPAAPPESGAAGGGSRV